MKPEWFAGRLRELRESLNWTRDVLAERSGVAPNTVRDIEQGLRRPTWETVLSLASALQVGVEEFTKEPAPRDPPRPGRAKQVPLEPPAIPKGRPRKAEAPPAAPPARKPRAKKGGTP
jgi:transcriptional regulator with XRE-family HTH domain